jgi:hypothetical protein
MCRLMDADREKKHDHLEQNVYVLQGHSELTSILTWGLLPHASGRFPPASASAKRQVPV